MLPVYISEIITFLERQFFIDESIDMKLFVDNKDSPLHTSSNCDKWVQL